MREFFSTFLAEIVSMCSLALGILIYRATTKEKREKKIADHALLINSVAELKDAFKKEYGGNSGGLREKLNSHSEHMTKEITRVLEIQHNEAIRSEAVANTVHRLEGAFEEHRLSHERSGQ
jgi:DNA helicase IV